MNNTTTTTATDALKSVKDLAYVCRLWVGDSSNRPVSVVEGKQSPKMEGESYYHTTPGGKIVHHPNAYGYRTIYNPSTRCTMVGAEWVLAKKNQPARRTDDGVSMLILPGRTVKVGTIRVIPGWIKGERKAIIIRGKRTYHISRGRISDFREQAPQLAAQAVAAWAKQDASKKQDQMILRDLETTRVTLADSRRAGNCIEGSLAFAERKLGMSRQEVLAGGHLFAVPAKRILAVANGQADQAMRAIRAAWLRETTVSI